MLTRLPAGRLVAGRSWPGMAASIWAYPVVGALVGAVGGVVFTFCHLPPAPAAVLALAAMALLTGALHEDGLADTADGFGGGKTAAGKLEIMRDSRIGSYGALALILSLALRGTALAALSPSAGLAALVAAGGLSRGAILLLVALLVPARDEGVAATLRESRMGTVLAGGVLALASTVLLPFRPALACAAGAALVTIGFASLARRQVGGYTGDVLGAGVVLAECAVLVIASAM